MRDEALKIVGKYWVLMNSNDFRSVGAMLSDDFVLEWPLSNERIRGRDNFASMNQEYPAHGRWQFTINQMIGDATQAVTDVSVTDGVQKARVISFFTIEEGRISRVVEFWPAKYEAPPNRKHLVEPIE